MKTLLLTFLCSIALFHPVLGEAGSWSERKLAKKILSIDRDLNRKRWQRVIDRTQKALPHCIAIHSESHQRCITMLRNINLSHERLYRFNPDSEQIRRAYTLAKRELGKSHLTTSMARDYYYKYSLFTETYQTAIPLALEIIEVETSGNNDPFEIFDRVQQLYALYGLTEQWPQEEAALSRLLAMAEEHIGRDSDDYRAAAVALAENYCIQKKYHEYFALINKTGVEASCSLR